MWGCRLDIRSRRSTFKLDTLYKRDAEQDAKAFVAMLSRLRQKQLETIDEAPADLKKRYVNSSLFRKTLLIVF